MSLRRTLALFLTVTVLAVLFTVPRAPVLVCRMTGEPMAPMAATPENEGSCCAVALVRGDDGQPLYALTSPGCCDLKQVALKRAPLGVPLSAYHLADLVVAVWQPAPTVVAAALRTVPIPVPPVADAAIPRGPPGRRSSPRAPPTFS